VEIPGALGRYYLALSQSKFVGSLWATLKKVPKAYR